jgi:hypothetical protein
MHGMKPKQDKPKPAAKKETPAASFNTGYWPDFSTGQPLRFACMTATLPM